jgi:hypothetical protein
VRHLPLLTNSAAKKFLDCPQAYYLSYERLIRPIAASEPLTFGDLMHKALEAWWNAAQVAPATPCDGCGGAACVECMGCGYRGPSEWLRSAFHVLAVDTDPWRRATLESLMIGYAARWWRMRWEGAPYDGAPIEVLAVEQEFAGPMSNPATRGESKTWQRGGKIDVLVRVRTDLLPTNTDPAPTMASLPVWVVEHKTSSEDFSAGSPYRARLRLDTQVSGYHVGARLLGHEQVAGVLYDVIGKPGLKPLKATPIDKRRYTKREGRLDARQRETDETVPEYQARLLDDIAGAGGGYYARFEVVRLADEEEAAARDTWMVAQAIRDAKRLNRWPRNPGACSKYGGRACEYLPICVGDATENDGTRYRRAETAHEELAQKAA